MKIKLKEFADKYENVEVDEEELKKTLEIKEEPKVWKPKFGEEYFTIASLGKFNPRFFVECRTWEDDEGDKYVFELGLCFKTKEEAEFALKKSIITMRLIQLASIYNKGIINWDDDNQEKWKFVFDNEYKKINIYQARKAEIKNVYFTSLKIAEKVLNIIGEDKIKKYYLEVEE